MKWFIVLQLLTIDFERIDIRVPADQLGYSSENACNAALDEIKQQYPHIRQWLLCKQEAP